MKIDKRFFLCICMLSIFCLYPFPVRASGSLVLLIDPQEASLPVGNQALLQVLIKDGESVNAFDLTLTYDQVRLSLAKWAHGDYLSNLNCLRQFHQPGRLELACTQVARPAVSGDGVLLELVFNTVAQGTSEVRIQQAILANPQGGTVQPERQHGSVTASLLPTFTPTRTPTRTATATRTPTRTPTQTHTMMASPTQAGSPSDGTTAYPVEGDSPGMGDIGVTGITRTITATPPGEREITRTPGAYPVSGEADHMADPGEMAPSNGADSSADAAVDQPRAIPFIEILLWVVLGTSLGVTAAVGVLLIIRKTKKDEDYLL